MNRKRNQIGKDLRSKDAQSPSGNSRGSVFLFGAAASGWLIYDMATAAEAPSQTLALMKYFILAVLVIAAAYSGVKYLSEK